jgi:hypothetical protein
MKFPIPLDSTNLFVGQTVLAEYSSTNRPVICTVKTLDPIVLIPVKPIWNPYGQCWNDSPIVYRHYQHRLYSVSCL